MSDRFIRCRWSGRPQPHPDFATMSDGTRNATLRAVLVLVALAALIASAPGSAAAFGTIDSGGQHREHERITRSALACADGAASDGTCFEPRVLDYLAGRAPQFGAVGAPDSDELSLPAAHCDDADFLEGGYPRTREQASAALVACVEHLRVRFAEAADAAGGLVDDEGRVVEAEVGLGPACRFVDAADTGAKCLSLEGLGRALHGAQDFYAHSNWADEADPSLPVDPTNPPGLDQPGPSAVLDLRSDTPPRVPDELTTGCFVARDEVIGVGACAGRVTHAALNKDRGMIDPDYGCRHRADDTPGHRRGQLRRGRGRRCRGDEPAVAGSAERPRGPVRRGARRGHGLRAHPRRSRRRLSGRRRARG